MAMNDDRLAKEDKLARMRALVDMGLWGDHITEAEERAIFDPGHGWMSHVRYAIRAMFSASPSHYDAIGEASMHKARRALASALFMGRNTRSDSADIVHLALEAGLDPFWHENNNADDNFLTLFARKGAVEPFKRMLMGGANPYWRDSCNETPLMLCLRGMDTSPQTSTAYQIMAEAMLAHGVDINHAGPPRRFSSPGGPPLKAVVGGASKAGLAWLLAHEVDPRVLDDEGGGLVHWLAETGNANLADMERTFGIQLEIDQPNQLGQTPLWIAIKHQNTQVADQLLARGAKLDVRPHAPHRHDSFDNDGNGVEPTCGKSLLQVLVENYTLDAWSSSLARRIHQNHPDCWSWTTPWGRPLQAWLAGRSDGQDWSALVQEIQLDTQTAPVMGNQATRRAPRL